MRMKNEKRRLVPIFLRVMSSFHLFSIIFGHDPDKDGMEDWFPFWLTDPHFLIIINLPSARNKLIQSSKELLC